MRCAEGRKFRHSRFLHWIIPQKNAGFCQVFHEKKLKTFQASTANDTRWLPLRLRFSKAQAIGYTVETSETFGRSVRSVDLMPKVLDPWILCFLQAKSQPLPFCCSQNAPFVVIFDIWYMEDSFCSGNCQVKSFYPLRRNIPPKRNLENLSTSPTDSYNCLQFDVIFFCWERCFVVPHFTCHGIHQ